MKAVFKMMFGLIIMFQLLSCNKSDNKIIVAKTAKKAVDNPEIDSSKVSLVDTFSFPVDSMLPVKMLQLETFHHDEVDENFNKKVWFGLFKNKESYTLTETKITIKPAYDAIVDEDESEHTGWEVSASTKDTCVVLIEKLPYLADRNVSSIKLREYVYPDEDLKFDFKGIKYTLYATGEKKKAAVDSDWMIVSNYKLYLTTTVDGNKQTELLTAKKNFDEQMITILFAGDIDGDDKLDLIIDTANHYNVSSPTLYLSKPASEGKIIKPIGIFTTVGC
ncbi:hypothetical protein EV143_104325 [Flavobacterium chryseum]|uniref:hypothetical protein n=1 Tax=Flavobacterium sp. P3160 TaxID=2512113 RepID=UPI0010615625|nr:hypothetical protein [Flavobacterium sp. P3160]TDO77559.1 hypothetical protein EV143_104325 [Flavobacterium sp. P3160]